VSRLLLALLPALLCGAAGATDINLSGVVVASPCTVDADTVSKLVEFDQIHSRNLVTAGSGGEWQDFQLLLTACPAGTQEATVTFSGVEDGDDVTAFENSGTAGNVALRLADSTHSVNYSNGSSVTANVAADRTATFPLAARIFTPLGSVSGGSFASAVNVDFTYQ
jgi:minor fimbrial subunit